MADREKIIKGLECCLKAYEHLYDNPCKDCPYEDFYNVDLGCIERTQADALELLKEQVAVEPKKESDGNPEKWASWWYVCGNCGEGIDWHDRYCWHCGRAVKWN